MQISPEIEAKIEALVQSGRFQSSDQALLAALDAIEGQEAFEISFIEQNRDYLEGALSAARKTPKREMTTSDFENLRQQVREQSHQS